MKKTLIYFSVLLLSSMSAVAFAQEPLAMGADLLNKKDCSGAVPYLLRAFEKDPKSKRVNLYLGQAYLCLNNTDSAAYFFSRTIDIKRETAPAYFGLAQVYMREKKYTDAIDNYNLAVNYDPKQIEYVIDLGEAYLATGSLDSANQQFYKATDMDPENPDALAGIGDVYAAQNIYDAAITNYKQALAIDSTNIEVRIKLGNMYMKTGKGKKAYEEFAEVSRQAPNNAQAQYNAGELLFANQLYKEAIPFLAKYHQLVPTDFKTLLQLAESAINAGMYSDAIIYYKEYVAKFPNAIGPKAELASAYYFSKDPAQSFSIFKTLPTDSLDVKDLVRYGLAANASGDTAATIRAWTHAVTTDTSLHVIENQLAGLLFAMKKYDQAISYFNKYLASNPTDYAAALNMGLCYIASQNYPDAIATLKHVTVKKPDTYLAWRWLALAYAASDSMEPAVVAYQHLISLGEHDTTAGADHSADLDEANRYLGYSQLMAGIKLNKKDPNAAKQHFQDSFNYLTEALKYNKSDRRTHVFLAEDYAFLGKIDAACKEIKVVLRTDPKNSQMLQLQKALSCE